MKCAVYQATKDGLRKFPLGAMSDDMYRADILELILPAFDAGAYEMVARVRSHPDKPNDDTVNFVRARQIIDLMQAPEWRLQDAVVYSTPACRRVKESDLLMIGLDVYVVVQDREDKMSFLKLGGEDLAKRLADGPPAGEKAPLKTFNLVKPKQEFEDVIETLKEFPSFSRMTDADRARVKFGDTVKIGCAGEWFWVDVLLVRDGKLYGRVDNDLDPTNFDHGLNLDDAVEFEPRHIRRIDKWN